MPYWLSFTVSFDGLLLLHFYKWRMGSEPLYALWLSFTVSFDGLLLLHFCKWRMGM